MNYGNVMEKDSSVILTFVIKHDINRSNLLSKLKKSTNLMKQTEV